MTGDQIYAAKGTWDSTGGVHSIYCYCDIIRNINIGDTTAPVLAVINYKGEVGDRNLKLIEYEPKNPIYIPVSKNIFDNIKVELRTKTGLYYPFSAGEVLLLVHIRPREPKL